MQRMYFYALLRNIYIRVVLGTSDRKSSQKEKILQRDTNQTKGVQQATMCEV